MVEALSTRDFLDRVEADWVGEIRASSLAAEVIAGPTFDPEQVENALTGLWRIAKQSQNPGKLAHWPAAVVVAMTYKAFQEYQQGAFWERFSESFVERPRQPWTGLDNKLWGEAFLISVGKLGMPTFATTRKYVGNVVMHAGIPTYCYKDFLLVLTRAIRAIGYEGPAAVAWLRQRLDTGTFANIDTPVRDFIETGDIFAADFVSRNVELLDRLQHGEDASNVGIAPAYVELAEEFVQDGGGSHAVAPRSQNQLRPTLQLDTFSDRLVLNLPPVSDAQGMHWVISADGETYDIKPPTAWSSTHGAESVSWDVPSPARRLIVASTHDPALTFDVALITDLVPYLLFSEDGTHISADSSVPAELVWILRLDDDSQISPQKSVATIARGSFPLGWSDWRLELIDLSRTSSFTVGSSPSRRVNIKSRAHVVCTEPVPAVTSSGLPVFTTRPEISLPSDVPTSAWSVSVKDLRTGAFLPAPTDTRRPLADLPDNLIGSYEIAVRGPLGRGARRRVCIVEALNVQFSPVFRVLNERGIEPCQVSITHAQTHEVTNSSPRLDGETVSAAVIVTSASGDAPLVIMPPSMAISLESPGEHPRWNHSPLSLRTDAFSDARILLRLPPNAKGVVGLRVNSSGVNHQVVDSARLGDLTTAIYPLGKAADTVHQLGAGQLTVMVPSGEILIASFRPANLAQSAALKDDHVHLDGLIASEVEVLAWALFAPWLGASSCKVIDSKWTIPAGLAGHGPIVFNLRVVDPWKSEPIPASPMRRDLFLVDAPTDARSDRLTQYLTGFNTARSGFNADKVMAQLSFSSPYAAPRLCHLSAWQVDELKLAAAADEKLRALSMLDISRPRRPHLVILAGCATEVFTPMFRATDAHLAENLAFHPLEGSLRDLDLLADEDSARTFPEMWHQASEQLGTDLMHILCGLADPSHRSPTFDANAAMLLQAPQAIRDQIISASKYLPRTVTDIDSRTIAAWQLFTSLDNHCIALVITDALTIIAEVSHLLRKHGLNREADAIRSREDPAAETKWMALPAVSLALALAARLGARGYHDLYLFAKSREKQWSGLSAVARKLCEIDLVLAEAYAASASRATHPAATDLAHLASRTEETND